MLKIGKRDAVGLTQGHANKTQSSDKDLFVAIRQELDALYAKLDADATVTDEDYAATLPKFEE